MSYNFYAFMDRMKYIKRWSLMRSVREENIMEHSQQVAMLAHALAVITNKLFGGSVDEQKCVLYAVYHECGEVMTGDLPTPIKYYGPNIKDAYTEIEHVINRKLLQSLPDEMAKVYADYIQPDESTTEYKLMKVADKLSAFIKCIDERLSGNREFDSAYERLRKQLDGLREEYPELDYFLNNFGEGYGKPLDIL